MFEWQRAGHFIEKKPKHTFLLKRVDVLAAGELKIRSGNIVNINNLSGHYVPGPDVANTYLDIF